MMNTANYGFMKPEGTDFYNIADFNANMDKVDTELKKANTAIEENKNTIESNKKATQSDISLIESTLGYTKKNLLPNQAVSHTVNDLTVTVNADKSVTVNGKPSVNTKIAINSGLVLKAGTYILSGCPETPPVMYRPSIEIELTKSGKTISDIGTYNSDIKGTLFTLEEDDVANCYIEVVAGQSTSKTFYPMIRREEIEDDTYEPYIANVNENMAIAKATLGYTKKNFLQCKPNGYPEGGYTAQGCTFLINDNKSVNVSGKATTIPTSLNYTWKQKLPKGRYILSGCPRGGGETTYHLKLGVYDNTDNLNNPLFIRTDYGNGALFDILEDGLSIIVQVTINSTSITMNHTFYPMIRPVEIADGTYEPYVADIDTRLSGELICQGTVSGGTVNCDFTPYKMITCYLYHEGYVFNTTIHTEMIADYETRRFITGYNKGYAQFNLSKNSIAIGGLRFNDIDNPNTADPFYVFGHR